jgi:hypothetical protein
LAIEIFDEWREEVALKMTACARQQFFVEMTSEFAYPIGSLLRGEIRDVECFFQNLIAAMLPRRTCNTVSHIDPVSTADDYTLYLATVQR